MIMNVPCFFYEKSFVMNYSYVLLMTNYFYPNFTNEERKVYRDLSNCSKVTKLTSNQDSKPKLVQTQNLNF